MQLKKVIPWQNKLLHIHQKERKIFNFWSFRHCHCFWLFCVNNKYCQSPGKVTTNWLLSLLLFFFPCQKCVLKQQKWRVPSLQTLVTDVLRWALIVVADARWYKTRLTDFQSPQYKMYRKSSLCSFVIQAIGKTTGASELLNQFFFASAFWWLSIPCGIEEIKDKVLCFENAELSNFKDSVFLDLEKGRV